APARHPSPHARHQADPRGPGAIPSARGAALTAQQECALVSCREFIRLFLDASLVGELPPRRTVECRAHVAGCADCRRYRESYLAVIAALRAVRRAPAADLPGELVRSILAAGPA